MRIMFVLDVKDMREIPYIHYHLIAANNILPSSHSRLNAAVNNPCSGQLHVKLLENKLYCHTKQKLDVHVRVHYAQTLSQFPAKPERWAS